MSRAPSRALRELLLELARLLDRRTVAEVLELEELAQLDLRVVSLALRIGRALRPLDRLLARAHLDQPVARDQLLRFRERAVEDDALGARVPDARALARRMQSGE